jgi:hypothetical protein
MSLRIARNVIRVVIILLIFECVTATFTTAGDTNRQTSIHQKFGVTISSLFASIISEKQGEERAEEERVKCIPVELLDFSQIAIVLSAVHTPHIIVPQFELRFDHHPALFKRHCVFII